ncbi:MAG TPA: hypothetical protein VMD06_02600 [Steroidobacteraceae bacterium]|nr:hypothetical protein [Steroidobacteraceae bacterium]
MPQSVLPSLAQLSHATKALFTAFLITIGFGYLVALFWLYSADIKPYESQGLSVVQGLQLKYHGARNRTRLEEMLNGPMAMNATPQQRAAIIDWIHDGATVAGFEQVKPIFTTTCAVCHNGKIAGIPALINYQQVRKTVVFDSGTSMAELARVSHIHLFGISLIFLATGVIFSLSQMNLLLKLCILVMPYVAIWADIGSWWLTKFDPIFAFVVLIGGALMGASLALQIFVPLWQMWVRPPPPPAG